MSLYSEYLHEIEARKSQGLAPKPIDSADLLSEIITQIKDLNHKFRARTLAWFVLVGWAIYPIGYMCMPGGWLSGVMSPQDVDLWYNIADAINKIGFGLVVYNIAITETKKENS